MAARPKLAQQLYDLALGRSQLSESRVRPVRARAWHLIAGAVSWLQFIRATDLNRTAIAVALVGLVTSTAGAVSWASGHSRLSFSSLLAFVIAVLYFVGEVRKVAKKKQELRILPTATPLLPNNVAIDGHCGSHRHRVDPPLQRVERRRRTPRFGRYARMAALTSEDELDTAQSGPTTSESWFCFEPHISAAFEKLNRDPGSVRVSVAPPKDLDAKLAHHRSAILLHRYDRKVRPFNGRTISQLSTLDVSTLMNGGEVRLAPSRYFNLICSDYLVDKLLIGPDGGVVLDGIDLVTDVAAPRGRALSRLENTRSSNGVGISTIAFDRNGRLILIGQAKHALSSPGLFAPSGSGSLEPRDILDARDRRPGEPIRLRDVLTIGMERELVEESNIDEAWILDTSLVGYFRWLGKGGKPEYCGVTWLNRSTEELTTRVRMTEHRWVRSIFAGVAVNFDQLRATPRDAAAALTSDDPRLQDLSNRLSTPLVMCLQFFGEQLAAAGTVPFDEQDPTGRHDA